MAHHLFNPYVAQLSGHILSAAARRLPMPVRDRYADAKGLLIVADAPALRENETWRTIADLARQKRWFVMGLKGAITILREAGLPVHFSCNMDPGEAEAGRTPVAEGVDYHVASSCHPSLFERLLGAGAKVTTFHSVCGAPREVELYREKFPSADIMQGGYTVANRAVALGQYYGFPRIRVAGAMFGWRPGVGYRGDGKDKAEAGAVFNDGGRLDGRGWCTKLDLLASAAAMARIVRNDPRVKIIGDSMVHPLSRMSDEELERHIVRKGVEPPSDPMRNPLPAALTPSASPLDLPPHIQTLLR